MSADYFLSAGQVGLRGDVECATQHNERDGWMGWVGGVGVGEKPGVTEKREKQADPVCG